MLGNFFSLTCPYLYDLETVTYFALFRNYHSPHALEPITKTTQLFLELYRYEGVLYIQPLKVHLRYSPTMNMLHAWEGDTFKPITSSALISSILNSVNWTGLQSENRPGFWDRAFLEAEEVQRQIQAGQCPPEKEQEMFHRVSRMAISRDEEMSALVSRYFSLNDVLDIHKRMIGSGLIGGKTVGMLAARRILQQHSQRYHHLLEAHDSFYVGSDVFYTYLVQNGVWWVRQKQRRPETFLEGAEQARQRILTGQFPPGTVKQFELMLDYYGQSPIIVRSSSLLEDNFGNNFAGKYESVFCPNQGPRERRLEDLLSAVRTIYASTMSEKALRYREARGLLEQDEQMALLVMRVSGAVHGRYFYPQAAGVGFSFNPYVWNEAIDPQAGVVRLVFGLGTRAVDRSDDDYTRIVALNVPEKRPETNFQAVRQYAQHRVDYLDLDANRLMSGDFADVLAQGRDLPVDMFATDAAVYDEASDRNRPAPPVLTFEKLLRETSFVQDMRDILHTLQQAYNHPVDIEFTLNFIEEKQFCLHLVQCRPLPVKGMETTLPSAIDIPGKNLIIAASGAVIGHSRQIPIDCFIYIVPERYGELPLRDRYSVARLIGRINRACDLTQTPHIMLLGPGRWGTSEPSLGIPVTFAEINRVSVLCEIVAMRENLVPDVSLGTHFLNELVEMDIQYLALFPQQGDNYLNSKFFLNAPNRLPDILPDAGRWTDVVKVIDSRQITAAKGATLSADALKQKVICYLNQPGE